MMSFLDTRSSSEDVVLNVTVTTPTFRTLKCYDSNSLSGTPRAQLAESQSPPQSVILLSPIVCGEREGERERERERERKSENGGRESEI